MQLTEDPFMTTLFVYTIVDLCGYKFAHLSVVWKYFFFTGFTSGFCFPGVDLKQIPNCIECDGD